MSDSLDNRIVSELRDLYNSNDTARFFFDWIMAHDYQEKDGSTLLDYITQWARAERPEVVSLCRKLDKIKIGKFIVGRRGKPSRITWNFDLLRISKIASGIKAEKGAEESVMNDKMLAPGRIWLQNTGAVTTITISKQAKISIRQLADSLGIDPNDIEIIFIP